MAALCLPAFFVVKYIILFFFLPPIPAHKGPGRDSRSTINYPTSGAQPTSDGSKAVIKMMYDRGENALLVCEFILQSHTFAPLGGVMIPHSHFVAREHL